MFHVADVRIRAHDVATVAPGDREGAEVLVAKKNYSAIPASLDGIDFPRVLCTDHPEGSMRTVVSERDTVVSDHIPESTLLAEAFSLQLACREDRHRGQ
jgi:hypothetical protein